jgi:hypothetical protein
VEKIFPPIYAEKHRVSPKVSSCFAEALICSLTVNQRRLFKVESLSQTTRHAVQKKSKNFGTQIFADEPRWIKSNHKLVSATYVSNGVSADKNKNQRLSASKEIFGCGSSALGLWV